MLMLAGSAFIRARPFVQPMMLPDGTASGIHAQQLHKHACCSSLHPQHRVCSRS